MDIGGPQYDVHPSDCAQFTGKSLISLVCCVFVALICHLFIVWGVSV